MNLTDLFKADFYFKGALAVMHLSATIIFSPGHLQCSSIFNGTAFFFKQALPVILFFIVIELIRKSIDNNVAVIFKPQSTFPNNKLSKPKL